MCMRGSRKLENPEQTHMGTGRACQTHRPRNCEAAMLPATAQLNFKLAMFYYIMLRLCYFTLHR